MKRLQQIAIDKTLAVQVKCVVNESVIDRNFSAIIDCLKELYEANDSLRNDMRQLNSKTSQFESGLKTGSSKESNLVEAVEPKVERAPSVKAADLQPLGGDELSKLKARLDQLEEAQKKNNIENLKDINLLIKEVKDLKKRMEEADGHKEIVESSNTDTRTENSLASNEGIRQIQKELQRHLGMMDELRNSINAQSKSHTQLQSRVSDLEKSKNSGSQENTKEMSRINDQLQYIRDKLKALQSELSRIDILEQKQRLGPNTQDIDNKFAELRSLLQNLEEQQHSFQESLNALSKKSDLMETAAKTQDSRTDLKSNMHNTKEKLDFNHDNEHRSIKEALKEIFARLEDLESGLKQSKDRIASSLRDIEDKTIEGQGKEGSHKLPNINKRGIKLKSQTNNTTKDEGSQKFDWDKKLLEIKTQLHQWLKQFLDSKASTNSKKDDEYLKDLELKIQELKMSMEKKADQEGVRKYMTYLQNRINQLFVIVAQPESEDALIARKGWGCLSCAKKLEKYKGRTGDHLNWNNFTTTNYSPPRIGFTQTQTNHHRSGERNRFGSLAEKGTNHSYEQHEDK